MKRYLALVIAFGLASTAHAQELEQGTGVLCDTQAQIERFASLDADLKAVGVINADAKKNVCAMVEVQYIRGKQVGIAHTSHGTAQLVEILIMAVKMHEQWATIKPEVQYTLFLIPEAGASLPFILVHDVPGIPTENLWWYQNAETNPEARPTFPQPWAKCCNHAEIVPMENIIFPTHEHGWQWNNNGEIHNIPDVVVHWSEAAPDNRPTLFVYLGVMTCFYPPQGGA